MFSDWLVFAVFPPFNLKKRKASCILFPNIFLSQIPAWSCAWWHAPRFFSCNCLEKWHSRHEARCACSALFPPGGNWDCPAAVHVRLCHGVMHMTVQWDGERTSRSLLCKNIYPSGWCWLFNTWLPLPYLVSLSLTFLSQGQCWIVPIWTVHLHVPHVLLVLFCFGT